MCRNIKMLFNFDPPVTPEEVQAASLQFVRKISGFNKPSKANEEAFQSAIDAIANVSTQLLFSLQTNAPAKNREEEAARLKARSARDFSKLGRKRFGAVMKKPVRSRISLCINRRKDQRTRRLARQDPREGPRNHPQRRPRDRRRVEVDGHSSLLPRRHRLHRRNLQERRQADLRQGSLVRGPSSLFNSSLEGNVRRAIDIHEGEKVNEAALKELIRAAVALNLESKTKSKPKARPRAAAS